MRKKGVLLINLGTPDDSSPKSVRRYLKEFLNDPRVIDLPSFIRWPLVNLLIIPFRYKKTAEAYQQIWTEAGSPLLAISKQTQQALASELGDDYQVELGMRYGKPSIQSAVEKLKHCTSITAIPLFPQYSSAANGSAIENLLLHLSKQWNVPELSVKGDFYNHPGFIQAFADVIEKQVKGKDIDMLVFSYHGLPERHVIKSDCKAQCDRVNACPVISDANRFCYRAQCYATTQLIAEKLGLLPNQYTVAFQSRLGRTPWIKPYTDLVLPELISKDIKNIAVVSPSFVADCLETLEEINIRMREQWVGLGGEGFTFVPCVNDSRVWVGVLVKIIL